MKKVICTLLMEDADVIEMPRNISGDSDDVNEWDIDDEWEEDDDDD
ncbi:MAG: hypothetical protein KBT39_12420 [Bacteroidales bacterium]|nr:hypothetical protein [Bacteroidales bacterium]